MNSALSGIQQILASELQVSIDEESGQMVDLPEQDVIILEEWEKNIPDDQRFIFHEKGRLPLHDKLEMMDNAKHEIVELGVRLNTFTNYFLNRSDYEFKDNILFYLEKGVNIKLYLIDPDHHEARIYFEDRGKVQEEELASPETVKEIIRKLQQISKEISEAGYPGTFQVYKYRHIPYSRFLVIDGGKPSGKMLVSPYLYGQKRAASPVLEIHKQKNFKLFQLYWESYKLFVKDAVLLTG